jgi:putative ABC transport system permease protein
MRFKKEHRDMMEKRPIESFVQDARFGLRMLAKSPGFTAVAVLTLALGIGADTAVYSLVDAVLLKPLPYSEADRLVIAVRKKPGPLRNIASYPDFTDWRASGAMEKSAAIVGRGFFLETDEGFEPLRGGRVSEEFFETLGVRPVVGRGFLPDEVRRGGNVAVISHALWTTRFAGDPLAAGKDLKLRGQIFRVVGILPSDFPDPVNPLAPRDLYVPLVVSGEERMGRNSQWLQVIGRLTPGTSLQEAQAVIETTSERAQREYGGENVQGLSPFTLIPLHEHHVGDVKPALWLILGAVGFVLLIVCANIANLMLARITFRQHELAMRTALGASNGRLAAQLVTENLLLAVLGGAASLGTVTWMIDMMKAISPVSFPHIESAGLNARVLGFALVTTLGTGLVFGMLPILRGVRMGGLSAFRQAGEGRARTRGALLIAEVALTMVLLVGALLTVTSIQRLLRVDPGFQESNLLTANLAYAGEWKQPAQHKFVEQLLERARALPGIRAAGAVDNLPFSGAWSQFWTTADEFAERARAEMQGKKIEYQQAVVCGQYFRAMGIPLKAGRFFDERDDAPGAASVIVSESLARTIWGDRDPLGMRVSDGRTRNARVVGIVGDVRHFGPETMPVPSLYRPLAQWEAWGVTLVVQAGRDALGLVPVIRESVRALDRSVILQQARTMEEILRRRTAGPRFLAVLLGSFGCVALLLAIMGTYGVLAYSVSRRTREIGVRLALGAHPGTVLRMVILQGMSLAGIGVIAGLGGAVALSRLLQHQLFEVSATDPATYAAAALLLAAAAFLACWVPGRKAARVDPVVALRYE